MYCDKRKQDVLQDSCLSKNAKNGTTLHGANGGKSTINQCLPVAGNLTFRQTQIYPDGSVYYLPPKFGCARVLGNIGCSKKRMVYCWTWPTYRWPQVLKFWLCNSSSEDVCPVRCGFQSFDTSAVLQTRHLNSLWLIKSCCATAIAVDRFTLW